MLTELIIEIAECERRTEIVRKLLASISSFEPYAAFKRLDKSRCGEISYQDIVDFMEDNNSAITSLEASYLLQFLDFNRDGRVTYTDFEKQILPKSDIHLRETVAARDSYYLIVNKHLSQEIEWALFKVLNQEVNNFRHLKEIKDTSESATDAFKCIDKNDFGYFTSQKYEICNFSLEEYLNKAMIHFDKQDIEAFFYVADRDEDKKISLAEFIHVIKPFHPSQILKDRERAFYSTPKKYRRLDNSPIFSQPRLAVNSSYQNIKNEKFVYKTPVKENETEIQKQKLLQQSDFNILDLFYHQPKAAPQLSFKKFCKQILPTNAPDHKPRVITNKTFQMMLNILRQ